MSSPCLSKNDSRLPLVTEQVDQACDRFEAAWKTAIATLERPRIEDYLGAVAEAKRSVLLTELLHLDIYYRRLHGEEPQPTDYSARFPDLKQDWLASALASRGTGGASRSARQEPRLAANDLAQDLPQWIG